MASRPDSTQAGTRPDTIAAAPEVSVIVPAFNAETTIAQTLRSIQRQTFQDWELLVCDDGSTDDTPAILATIAATEPRLRVVRQPNAGAGAARNAAIALARGRLFQFLDADDLLEPRCIEVLAPLARQHGAACGGWTIDDASGHAVGITVSPGPGAVGLDTLLESNPVAPSATMLSREIMSLEPFSDVEAAADYDLWLRLARHGVVWHAAAEVVCRYRLLKSSNSKKAAKALHCVVRCLRDAFDAAADDPRIDTSTPRLHRVLRAHGVRYATLKALLEPSPGQDEACDLLESVGVPLSTPAAAGRPSEGLIGGHLLGDAAFEAALAMLARRPTLDEPLSWTAPLRTWWAALEAERWLQPDAQLLAVERLADRCVDPQQVIDHLLEGATRNVVIIGHGANGRALEAAAVARGHAVAIRDDRYEDTTTPKHASVPACAEPMDAPLQRRTAIVSPQNDGALAARFAEARRWSLVSAARAQESHSVLRRALLHTLAA